MRVIKKGLRYGTMIYLQGKNIKYLDGNIVRGGVDNATEEAEEVKQEEDKVGGKGKRVCTLHFYVAGSAEGWGGVVVGGCCCGIQ